MYEVPITKEGDPFVAIPASTRLAILLPTGRWTPLARAIIGSLVGVASEEIAVLIADNCENEEKREFLRKIRSINPYILAVSHEKNIGSANNFYYLFDWCREIEFFGIMADDDWMSPTYHEEAYRALLENPDASSAEAGTTLVDLGDGRPLRANQPSMCGLKPIERVRQWNDVVRVTMYNVSRRASVNAAIEFIKAVTLHGPTLTENVWELCRLAHGHFLSVPGEGVLVHYPAQGSNQGDRVQRLYDNLFKGDGLQPHFVHFGGLSTAVQCAMFLAGSYSPISDPEQRELCAQHVFSLIYTNIFLPAVSGESSEAAAKLLFANHPRALEGFRRFCMPPFSHRPHFDRALVDWFVEVVKALEIVPVQNDPPISESFRRFVAVAYPATT